MEPSARFERAAFSLPRRCSFRWSYEGVSWGSAIRTRISDFKDLRDAGYPIPHQSRVQVSNPLPRRYKLRALAR